MIRQAFVEITPNGFISLNNMFYTKQNSFNFRFDYFKNNMK